MPHMTMSTVRVLIIDEHEAVRRALMTRLSSHPDIEMLTAAGDFEEGLARARQLRPDVILLEPKGAGNWGTDPISELHRELEGEVPGIIVLTSYADDAEREGAFQAGARRYMLKDINSDQLLTEIKAVAVEQSLPK